MRVKPSGDKSELLMARGLFTERRQRDAHQRLMADVFEDATQSANSHWWTAAYFDDSSRCVASIEARVLTFAVEGRDHPVSGLRRLAVDPAWRGRGLARDLVTEALDWCAKQSTDLTMLFTGTPSLYTPFGFAPVPQHAFVGPAPEPLPSEPSRELDLPSEAALLASVIARRTPVSSQIALMGANELVVGNILPASDNRTAYSEQLDAIVLYETDGEDLTLIDIIAESIPSIGAILGTIGARPRRLRTLFPPDRIGWSGRPEIEDNGLMARGAVPAAFARPFMLPPTAEF